MQCYLINAYVTHKAITPIRALGQLKFQWSSLPTGVHDKGLKIFSVHKQLARAKKKTPNPTARKQFSGLPQFMEVNVRVSLPSAGQSVRWVPRGDGERTLHPPVSVQFLLSPPSAAVPGGSCSRTGRTMARATAGRLTAGFKSSNVLSIPAGFAGGEQGNCVSPISKRPCSLHPGTMALQI